MVSWLNAIALLPENPFAATVCKLGGATAVFGQRLGPLFNRVLDFSDEDVQILDETVRLYADRGLPCRIDVNPHAVGTPTMAHLVEAGFRPFRHHDHLYGLPYDSNSPRPFVIDAVEIQVVDESNRSLWAEVWRLGFLEVTGIEEADRGLVTEATSNLAFDPQWTLFLAFFEGKPAAAAGLYVNNGIGSLVFAGTDPDFRGRGCQSALLNARLRMAAEKGCDLVAAQAALNAQSHRNMQRAGLAIAYTRAFWVRKF